jgi:(p)ppGpp synthase/HD superfamily hydrolase
MNLLEKAIGIAVEAHRGQVDKAGAPYILHPLRMMTKMSTENEMIVAILHDVVEDTPWTLDRLRQEGFPEVVITALDCVTRRPNETYEEFVTRAAANPMAKKVKRADLEDNMDLRRIEEITPKDLERIERYHRAWQALV